MSRPVRSPRPVLDSIVADVLALVLAVAPLRAQCPDGTPPPCAGVRALLPRVQVLGFLAPDSADVYLASGIAEDVRAALLGTRAIVLVGPRARSTAAEYVLGGSVHRTRDGLTVSARIERVASGTVLWESRVNRLPRDLPGVAPEIASHTLRVVGVRSTPTLPAASADPVAYDLHIRARYQLGRFNEPALARAVMLYREAIARDSTSPLGWAGLARYHPRRDLHFQMHLRGEPAFDGIRGDPRFRALLSPQP